MRKDKGYIVKTKDGMKGRTFHDQGLIKGKQPVYLINDQFVTSEKPLLCDPKTLIITGYID